MERSAGHSELQHVEDDSSEDRRDERQGRHRELSEDLRVHGPAGYRGDPALSEVHGEETPDVREARLGRLRSLGTERSERLRDLLLYERVFCPLGMDEPPMDRMKRKDEGR